MRRVGLGGIGAEEGGGKGEEKKLEMDFGVEVRLRRSSQEDEKEERDWRVWK